MISNDAIMSKLQAYANSATGKKKMKDCVYTARRSGKGLASGAKVVDINMMTLMANDLVEMIRQRLPASIAEVGGTLVAHTPVKHSDGSYTVTLSFDSKSLHRDSLENDGEYYKTKYNGHTGAGIDNIVALFNNGYSEDSIGRVWGKWSSHNIRIHNKESWDGLQFMQDAATEFNTKYGAEYNVIVQLGNDYTE